MDISIHENNNTQHIEQRGGGGSELSFIVYISAEVIQMLNSNYKRRQMHESEICFVLDWTKNVRNVSLATTYLYTGVDAIFFYKFFLFLRVKSIVINDIFLVSNTLPIFSCSNNIPQNVNTILAMNTPVAKTAKI